MKTKHIILISILLLILAGCVAYNDCNDKQYESDITIALDRTGSHTFSLPNREAILQAFEGKRELWKGYHFRLVSLSDVDLNRGYEASIKPGCSYTSNVYERKKEMANFSLELDSATGKLLSEPIGRPSSSLYIPLANELSRLAESHAKKKTLIVFSDLLEESYLFSFGSPKTLQMLKENPDNVSAMLEKEAPLPSLKGVEIYVIFQPVNSAESNVFHIVSGFYQRLLESKGARVNISANLIIQ